MRAATPLLCEDRVGRVDSHRWGSLDGDHWGSLDSHGDHWTATALPGARTFPLAAGHVVSRGWDRGRAVSGRMKRRLYSL